MNTEEHIVSLDVTQPIWERFFTVAPLVLIGTRDEDGEVDLAPKHMVTPMGWENYFGFVCTPRHGTFRNARRSGVFSVSYPRPSQLLYASLAASPRCGDADSGDKPVLRAFDTRPATRIAADFIVDACLYLECELYKVVDGFGENCLLTGRIVAAHARRDTLRASEWDDQDLIHDSPLLAYLPPGRFASIERSSSFPFPAGMKK